MIKQKSEILVSRIRGSSFVKSILTLSAGVIVSQVISFGAMPIISRIYSPAVLGDFSLITSNSSIIGVIVSIGLMSAIMIPKDEDEARDICKTILFAIVILSTIMLIIAVSFSGIWQIFRVSLDYKIACIILYFYVVALNISSICYAYVNRQKKYNILFWNPVIIATINSVVSIVLGFLGCGLWGYSIGNILALIVSTLIMLTHANPFKRQQHSTIKRRRIFILRKYGDFVKYAFPANIIGTISQQIPTQMISKLFGNTVLGSYSMSMMILGIPSKLLASPINRVYYKEAIDRYNQGENIGEFSFRILETNIKIALIPIMILIVFSEPLFVFFLGDKWKTASLYTSILAAYQLVAFCNSCLSGKYIIIGKQRTILILNVIASVFYTSVFLVCKMLSIYVELTIVIFALSGALFELIDTAVFIILTKIPMRKFIRFTFIYLLLPLAGANLIRQILYHFL